MDATESKQTPWMQNLVRLVLSGCLIAFSPQILAKEDEADEAAQEEEAPAAEVEEAVVAADDQEPVADELVVVTGSRLKRDTYSSIAPLQIITAEVSREAGLIDAGDILRESSATTGNQVDLTFQGYVLDNGPGATEVSLRGLGGNRTLILINGRRMAPSGVEGAPVSPDIGLIPGSLVGQFDLLLDGASSVYGSDAIGGVANVILRKDFDGFELDVSPAMPKHNNGFETVATLTWGKNFDRGFVGAAAEWFDREAVTLADRPWTAGCSRHEEIDQTGRRRHQEVYYPEVYGMEWDDCRLGSLARRVFVPGTRYGSIYYTPGYSNGGWGNFSESNIFVIRGIDGDGDGQTDFSFRDYDLNGKEQFAHLRPELSQNSVMAYGEYTLEGDMNLTPFFEVLWTKRDFFSDAGAFQLFPDVPANNPFNLCNPAAENGVDCGLAWNALLNNPHFGRQFVAAYGIPPQALGFLYSPPLGPIPTVPIVSVRGDRTQSFVDITQLRLVGGMAGDLPWLDFGGFSNWTFDLGVVYTTSDGASRRPGIREDKLNYALGAYSTTHTPCENDTGEQLASDVAAGCVPVNMFAPSLYPESVVGHFATSGERNYVFDDRDFDTVFEQTLVSFYMTGNVFQLPSDWIVGGIGFEYRIDDLESIPDHVARDGLFIGYFADGGAVGEKYTREFFGELEIPIIAGQPAAEELVFNISARFTDDEFYGGAWTHSYKMAYRPINSLLLRATTGTSYRAPNLRELFIVPQTGFLNVFDPCLIPGDAIDELTGNYVPEGDDRDQTVLDNCRASGVDPTVAHNNGFNTYSVEVGAGGTTGVQEELSESLSAGFAYEQNFTNAFDLSIGMNYYEIEVTDSIIEPTPGYIVYDCYYSTTGSSFCPRIQREADPARPLIDYVDRSFINRDSEIHRGVDLNVAFEDTWTVFDRAIDVTIDLIMHRQIEASDLFINDQGVEDFDDDYDEWGYPELQGQLAVRADYGKWRFAWTTFYLGSVHQDPDGLDDWDEGITGSSDTCYGPPDDVLCRDVGFAEEYYMHSVSVGRTGDAWQIRGGIRNLFDTPPPVVDGNEVFSTNNSPIGYGYDYRGKRYFLTVRYLIGGLGAM
ncbi:MAG: TonB-dependent receptor [Gammaproteobacteria bacterium]|nr:TonB-dependent receptor [Gammaproteobacteria bacterium]